MRTKIAINRGNKEEIYEITIPKGWYRVWRGAIVPGDKYLDLSKLPSKQACFVRVDAKTLSLTHGPYSDATWYACLIRRGLPVEDPCHSCQMRRRCHEQKFCHVCFPSHKGPCDE